MVSDDRGDRVPRQQALGLSVGELMIAHPKTLEADAEVGAVRRAFEHSSQRVVLLVDGERFAGAIERSAIGVDVPATAPAISYATTKVPSVTPSTRIADAVGLLERNSEPRLIVLDDDGTTLRGLLCFNRSSASFCVE